jgi:hypothetical protein
LNDIIGSGQTKKGETGEEQSKSMYITFLSYQLAGHTVNSLYYCDFYEERVKMCENFISNFGDKRTGSCIATTLSLTFHFHEGIFGQNNMTVIPTHRIFPHFPD